MKHTEAMLSPVFPQGIPWAYHGGSDGRGHHSRFPTFQGVRLSDNSATDLKELAKPSRRIDCLFRLKKLLRSVKFDFVFQF